MLREQSHFSGKYIFQSPMAQSDILIKCPDLAGDLSLEVGSDDPGEVLYCFNPLAYGFYLDSVSRKKLLLQ